MRIQRATNQIKGLTLIEVLVVIAVIVLLAAMFLPALPSHHRPSRINCSNNLKQIGLSYRIWAGDNGDKFPMEVSVTNGGTMELFRGESQFQNLPFLNYLAMPNELSVWMTDGSRLTETCAIDCASGDHLGQHAGPDSSNGQVWFVAS